MSSGYLLKRQRSAATDASRHRLAEIAVAAVLDADHPPTTRQTAFVTLLVEAELHRTGSPLAPTLAPLNKASASTIIKELQSAAKARRTPRFDAFGNRKP